MKQIIDNFDLVLEKFFDEPLTEDEFYFIDIIQRIKDGNFKGKKTLHKLIAYYPITSKQQFIDLKDELIRLSRENNARVYFDVNKRSFAQVNNFVTYIENKHKNNGHVHKSAKTFHLKLSEHDELFYHACDFFVPDTATKYLLDLDNIKIGDEKYNEILSFIGEDNVFLALPSKTGTHLVTKNVIDEHEFRERFKFDISKTWPITLYFEWDDGLNE